MAKLRKLERLSRDARRRMGLNTIEDDLQALVKEEVAAAVANSRAELTAQGGGGQLVMVSMRSGLKSSPTPGRKKVTNLFVTPDGQFEVFYETDS